ncbi:efflux RND transporter permease subunit [Paraflavitalea pollutisoli]|uniref:efflux RND transporter permease subunit n=1 Tax=Paraflavitalea pollutisoli TaxID=3034143 RepID=UPI0023EDE065|nr:efflux RND transporter permease subunit [Paraflavitalea sp. H1-2-19X]
MVRYLIRRPIAVLMLFAALLITGLSLIHKIPVSLLPNIDVPQMVVQVNYPNTAAEVMEQSILAPIREALGNADNLRSIESKAANHIGTIEMTFEYGTEMDLAYIAVNEKLDRLSSFLPRDMPRPEVMRVNTSDIPIVRVQVIPKAEKQFLEVSRLTEKILKRRIEQLEGVSLVDINGLRQQVITVVPDKEALSALNLHEGDLSYAIQAANTELGGLTVKDGQYKYFVRLDNELRSESDIAALPLVLREGTAVALGRIAQVKTQEEAPTGYHLYNGKEGLVITIQKQSSSRMNELVPKVKEAVEQFRRDFPQIEFGVSQDQSFLLDAGISNLWQDLLYGGLLTVVLLLLFLGNWAPALLMSISIPLSLIITFIFFYVFNISFNIISLSGLALGVGMLIDNSIVVIDNITRRRNQGLSMQESSVQGTNEVIAPVISQVLTTVAVYAPLLLLSGMAGSLVYDQAIGLTICLCVSLLVAFILAPLLYTLLVKRVKAGNEDTRFYTWVAKGYHRMVHHILRHKLPYLLVTVFVMCAGIGLSTLIPVSALPRLEKKESLVLIDWNAPVDAPENLRRIKELLADVGKDMQESEADVGIRQFMLQHTDNSIQRGELYYSCREEALKATTDQRVKAWMSRHYPAASLEIVDAPNAFTQLFASTADHYLEARFKMIRSADPSEAGEKLKKALRRFDPKDYVLGMGFIREPSVTVVLNYESMKVYGVNRGQIEDALRQQFGVYTISQLKRYGDVQAIRLQADRPSLQDKLSVGVRSNSGTAYPLSLFVAMITEHKPKYITADRSGVFQSVVFDQNSDRAGFDKEIRQLALEAGYSVTLRGQYFENQQQVTQLWWIFLVVLLLLYVILAVQYESLVQPLIVMLTIPLGVAGGLFLLWVTGGTLDVMAAIGFIVILGLIVDDPILKIETLNRLEKRYRAAGLPIDQQLMEQMIHEAGDICLKPLLMVSLTTSIALVPVLFVSGIGNDLQKPLAIVIIGGLTIGTFFTTWFIPIAYWYITVRSKKKNKA